MNLDKILEIIAENNWKPLPEIVCQQCHTSDPLAFDNIYYIEKGGNLPEGWVIWCKRCIECFEISIKSIGKNIAGLSERI